jgi:hypothetical protein
MTDAQMDFEAKMDELRKGMYDQRTSTGTQAIRSYLKIRQQDLDMQLRACGDHLFHRLQGMAVEVMSLIDAIENGPVTLPPELAEEETDNDA